MSIRPATTWFQDIAVRLLAIASLAAGLPAYGAVDTMTKIRESRKVVIGVRESAQPFSFADAHRQPVGYAVDLCLNAVDEIKHALKIPDLNVEFKYVTGSERIPRLVAGEIDMECGTTTNTVARQEKVDFSYTFFVAAMRVLVPRNVRIETLADLDGLPVALSKGTTSEKLFNQLAGAELRRTNLIVYSNNGDAYKALKDGKVRAFAQDDSLLLGLVSSDKTLDQFGVSALALSVEPYAVMVRKGDAALLAAIDHSLARLYATGEIKGLYDKWFQTDSLSIKMNRLTRDSFARPNKQAGVAIRLGYSL